MKKLGILLILITCSIACKTEHKKEDVATSSKEYRVDGNRVSVGWTAYKTTEKVPVKGKFTVIKIKEQKSATTPLEALDALKFSIPASSIFSNNEVRDNKLKKLFFGVLEHTDMLTGTFRVKDAALSMDLTLNGITKNIALRHNVIEDRIDISSVLDLKNWKAQKALAVLNEACYELHKGVDGISKTWDEVAIKATVYLHGK